VGQGSNPWVWIGFVVLFITIVLTKVISLKMTDQYTVKAEEVTKAREDRAMKQKTGLKRLFGISIAESTWTTGTIFAGGALLSA
jgi:heme exporter protein D